MRKLIKTGKIIFKPYNSESVYKRGYTIKPMSRLHILLANQSVCRNNPKTTQYLEMSNKRSKFYKHPIVLKMPVRTSGKTATSLNRYRKSSFFVRHAAKSPQSHLKTLSWILKKLKTYDSTYLQRLKLALPHISLDLLQLAIEQHFEIVSNRNLQRRLKRRRARSSKATNRSLTAVQLNPRTSVPVKTSPSVD